MTRSASLTVRLPGASTAPATRTRTCFQTGAVKQSRKADNQVARTGGTSTAPAAAGERCVLIASVESSRGGRAQPHFPMSSQKRRFLRHSTAGPIAVDVEQVELTQAMRTS